MNPVVTSKEEILKTSRELIQRQGWSSFNVRSVAAACGVAVGSIYNYFESKSALAGAVVESVWRETFHRPEGGVLFQDTLACLTWMYERMEYGCNRYPDCFTLHSLGFLGEDRQEGKQKMHRTWQHILDELCAVLKRDTKIRPDAFNTEFTAEKFADVLFSLMLSAFLRKNYDPSAVLEVVRRTVYRTTDEQTI